MPGVNIILDEPKALLDRVGNVATARGLALVGARAVGSLVKQHLFALDGQRHRQGGAHFYAQAARSVTTGAVPQGATVSITQQGFRQRLFGGRILPKKKFLTIPACPETYGKRAGEFPDLVVRRVINPATGALQFALVRKTTKAATVLTKRQGRSKRDDSTFGGITVNHVEEVMFWLVRSVNQTADASVLPRAQEMSAVAMRAMQGRIERLQGRGNTNAGGES